MSVEDDVIYALSSRKFGVDYKLAVTKVDINGEVLDCKVTEVACQALGCTEKLGDSYFISTYSNDNEEKVLKVEEAGQCTNVYTEKQAVGTELYENEAGGNINASSLC